MKVLHSLASSAIGYATEYYKHGAVMQALAHGDADHRPAYPRSTSVSKKSGKWAMIDRLGRGNILVKPDASSKTNRHYGRELVHSGISGLRTGRDAQLHGQPLSAVLTRSARASLNLAALGACAGLLQFCLSDRRRIARTVAWGVAGGVIGFVAGFTWKTRDLTATMARSALKEMGTVRDERWLDKHPISYG